MVLQVESKIMGVQRVQYDKVCAGLTYYPGVMSKALNEALRIFQEKDRNGLAYNDDHPITIGDMREIIEYMDKIWANEEIYRSYQEVRHGV